MIQIEANKFLIEKPSELPDIPETMAKLYMDFETTSENDKIASTNVWRNCKLLGVAFTWDDMPQSYYLPLRHRHGVNLPIDVAHAYTIALVGRCRRWVNHSIKYDAHVLRLETGYDVANAPGRPEIHCTLQQAKFIDSDRLGFGLDQLSKAWLNKDISEYESKMKSLYLGASQDYAKIHPHAMCAYACEDVLTNRQLDQYIEDQMPGECKNISRIEAGITSLLIDMERIGFHIKPIELCQLELQLTQNMILRLSKIHDAIGYHMNPNSPDQLYDLIVNTLGYPILERTESGNASFGEDTLKAYARRAITPKHRELLQDIIGYKASSGFLSKFVNPYSQQETNGILHSWYNQVLRTGRMSAVNPNLMAVSGKAKELIHPAEGQAFFSVDYSQIEYRLIAHYCQDPNLISAYNADCDTDFHSKVSEMTHTPRKHAKKVNFTVAYGGGAEVLVVALYDDQDLVDKAFVDVTGEVNGTVNGEAVSAADIEVLAHGKIRGYARELLRTYSREFPHIRPTARQAAAKCAARGYVFNLAGRRRHIPQSRAHIAFNTIMQSGAADLVKERMLAVDKMLRERNYASRIIGQVHDELLFQGPIDEIENEGFQLDVLAVMESTPYPLRVPIRCSYGTSRESWKGAGQELKAPRKIVEARPTWNSYLG